MKVLVTGGAGYIGSVVVTQLLEVGHEVIVLDNLSLGHRDAVPTGASFVNADISKIDTLFTANDGIEAIFHFAAFSSVEESVKQPEKYHQNNTLHTQSLLHALRELNIKKLIFSSSAAVYGNPESMPVTEDSPTLPTNPYGASKLAVDNAIMHECVNQGLSAMSLRYFNVAGAYGNCGERHTPETHIIPLIFTALTNNKDFTIFGSDYATKDGTCVRDYIHVSDVARAHILALEGLTPGKHTIYNLGNGLGFSNLEVLNTVEKITGRDIPYIFGQRRDGDPATLIASSQKASDELGWHPEKPELETIIADAWEFYTR